MTRCLLMHVIYQSPYFRFYCLIFKLVALLSIIVIKYKCKQYIFLFHSSHYCTEEALLLLLLLQYTKKLHDDDLANKQADKYLVTFYFLKCC